MKTYFESKDLKKIIPFINVKFVIVVGNTVRAYHGSSYVDDYMTFPANQYDDYIKWLEATTSTEKEPKQITLTAEQVAKIVKKIECDCHLYCKNKNKNNKNNCMFCNFEPTDEFVVKVNEVIK